MKGIRRYTVDGAVESGGTFIFLIGYTPSLMLISMKSFV